VRHALCLALLLMLCACTRPPEEATEAKPKAAAAAPSATLRYGGDTEAWVGPLGNMQDQSYCAADLKLPLAKEPVWELGYTSAEFSGAAPSPILHYAGTLAVCARSPQLMLLDAASGRIIANEDVYARREGETPLEEFHATYFSPAGRLLAVDAVNNLYCFDTRSLARLWHRPNQSDDGSSALVTDARRLFASWGEARNWNLHAVGIEDGAPGWGYPFTADPGDLGVTLSRSGILLGYAYPSQLRAVRSSDGRPLWTVHERSRVAFAPLDEQRQQIYAVLSDESLVCRDLASGTLRWRYSWAGVLSAAEREELMVRSRLRKVTRRPLEVHCSALAVADDGLYASLQTGHVFHLSPAGQRQWAVKLDAPVVSMVVFDNALLAVQEYQIPDVQEQNKKGKFEQARPPDQFNLTPPAWPNLVPEKGVRKAMFSRVVALSRENGAILSSVDTEVASLSNLCPAGTNLVFGGVRRGQRFEAAAHYITAYNWVEP
jgi:outer membrane protein assembly factor BamB